MLEAGGGQRLAPEARHEGLVLGQMLGEQLDRHRPLEHGVGGHEDGGHAAGSEPPLDPVAPRDVGGGGHQPSPGATVPPPSPPGMSMPPWPPPPPPGGL